MQAGSDLIMVDLAVKQPEFFVLESDFDVLIGNATILPGQLSDAACDMALEIAMVGPVSTLRSAMCFQCGSVLKCVPLLIHGVKSMSVDCPSVGWQLPISDTPTLEIHYVDKKVNLSEHLSSVLLTTEIVVSIPVLRISATAKAAAKNGQIRLSRPLVLNEQLPKKHKMIDLVLCLFDGLTFDGVVSLWCCLFCSVLTHTITRSYGVCVRLHAEAQYAGLPAALRLATSGVAADDGKKKMVKETASGCEHLLK